MSCAQGEIEYLDRGKTSLVECAVPVGMHLQVGGAEELGPSSEEVMR
jgi:hypothetical protein